LKQIIVFLFALTTTSALATVNYLTVNHITKELFWAETGGYIEVGFIGWEIIPERKHHEDAEKYLARGYS